MSRPGTPKSYIVNLNYIINLVMNEILRTCTPRGYYGDDIDIVIPVYESFDEKTASHIVWILDDKMYCSTKSRFVESIMVKRGVNGEDTFYIYDKFKSDSYSHKNSYKQFMVDVQYPDSTDDSIYVPVYWRIN